MLNRILLLNFIFIFSLCVNINFVSGSSPVCGDGKVQGDEQCDDGDRTPGDGCNSYCQVEQYWTCSGSPSVCKRCGDGIIQGSEGCDDNNLISGDGCNSTCYIEPNWKCFGVPSVCNQCGDGVLQGLETCDDENQTPGDGCNSTCGVENDWQCTGVPSQCTLLMCTINVTTEGQACNDSNTVSGDGCSATLIVEPRYTCSGSPSVCRKCGDGIVSTCETCDDLNTHSNDGCSSQCLKEAGWTCSGIPSVCKQCGDGVIQPGEQCDDSNSVTGDGCSSCTIEPEWICTGSPSLCRICGDGIIQPLEGCDDQNLSNGDGCSSLCSIEVGWNCTGTPSLCSTICGDGIIQGLEECDDGNSNSNDGCSSCNISSGWTCNGQPSICQGICGDNATLGAEECDDGNTIPKDGCSSTCQVELGWICSPGSHGSKCEGVCGNGVKTTLEGCDDGNNVGGDGCSDNCQVEPQFICTGERPSLCSAKDLSYESSSGGGSNGGAIAAGIIIPLLIIAAIAVVVFIIWRKHKAGKIELPHISVVITHPAHAPSSSQLNSVVVESDSTSYFPIGNKQANRPVSSRYTGDFSSPQRQWEIDHSEIQIEKELGRGAFGVVYAGTWRNQKVAVKKLIGEMSIEQLKDFLTEAELMHSILPHENVVQLYGVCLNPPCIVLKYYSNGSLLQYIRNPKNSLTMATVVSILKGVAAGCSHLHHEKIVHRDLAARNVLLSQNMTPVVSDFGFARAIHHNNISEKTQSTIGPIRWMSPESLRSQDYSFKTDVWSWGVTAWEIINRKDPFQGLEPVTTALEVVNGKITQYLQFNSNIPQKLVELIHRCWDMEPLKRPSFQEIYDSLCEIERDLKST